MSIHFFKFTFSLRVQSFERCIFFQWFEFQHSQRPKALSPVPYFSSLMHLTLFQTLPQTLHVSLGKLLPPLCQRLPICKMKELNEMAAQVFLGSANILRFQTSYDLGTICRKDILSSCVWETHSKNVVWRSDPEIPSCLGVWLTEHFSKAGFSWHSLHLQLRPTHQPVHEQQVL